MPLICRNVTARMIAANRRNAQRSTGPRTVRGKAQSRLNALSTGARSRQLTEYLHLWFRILLYDPRLPPPPWRISEMPIPKDSSDARGPSGMREIRELLHKLEPFLRPHFDSASGTTLVNQKTTPPRPRAEGRKTKNSFFDQQSRQEVENKEPKNKRSQFSAETNWQRTQFPERPKSAG